MTVTKLTPPAGLYPLTNRAPPRRPWYPPLRSTLKGTTRRAGDARRGMSDIFFHARAAGAAFRYPQRYEGPMFSRLYGATNRTFRAPHGGPRSGSTFSPAPGQCMGRMAATTTTKPFIQQQGQGPPRAGTPTRDMIFLFCRPLRPAFPDRISLNLSARGHRCRLDRIGRQHHKRNNKPAAFSF